MFVIPILFSLVTFAVSMLGLYLGEVHHLGTRDDGAGHHAAHHSCSYPGPHSHLLWRFAYSQVDHLPFSFPNWFAYFLPSLCFLYLRPLYLKLACFFCYHFMSIVTAYLVDFSVEGSSFWCLTSISIAVLIIIEPLIVRIFNPERLKISSKSATAKSASPKKIN